MLVHAPALQLVFLELLDNRLGGAEGEAHGRKRRVRAKAGRDNAVAADIQVLEPVHLGVRVRDVRLGVQADTRSVNVRLRFMWEGHSPSADGPS